MEKIKIECNKLILGKKEVYFDYKIGKTETFENVIIVLLDDQNDNQGNENVFGVSEYGKILWQIKPREYPAEQRPFVNVYIEDHQLWIVNFGGYTYSIDSSTGDIIERKYTK